MCLDPSRPRSQRRSDPLRGIQLAASSTSSSCFSFDFDLTTGAFLSEGRRACCRVEGGGVGEGLEVDVSAARGIRWKLRGERVEGKESRIC